MRGKSVCREFPLGRTSLGEIPGTPTGKKPLLNGSAQNAKNGLSGRRALCGKRTKSVEKLPDSRKNVENFCIYPPTLGDYFYYLCINNEKCPLFHWENRQKCAGGLYKRFDLR